MLHRLVVSLLVVVSVLFGLSGVAWAPAGVIFVGKTGHSDMHAGGFVGVMYARVVRGGAVIAHAKTVVAGSDWWAGNYDEVVNQFRDGFVICDDTDQIEDRVR